MAHIKVDKREFEELLGEEVSDDELAERASFLGAHWNHVEGPKWDVEIYPNRPDLLSVEGLARAYRGFFDIVEGPVEYSVEEGDIKVEVDSSVENVRPYIGGAVVRNLELTEKKINGLIQLQEKLHQTVGRRRDKIAIGLHDMEEISPPYTYKAVEPGDVKFTPLDYDSTMTLEEILEDHDKGKKYGWILDEDDEYPVIVDSEGKVLSFPPIINNQLTEVGEETTDLFIDVTGKDRETVLKVLNILVTALAERGGEVESVQVDSERLPDLEPEGFELDPDYFRSVSGLGLDDSEIVDRLERMKFGAEENGGIGVEVPAYRTDIMHQYDLIEDIVIAHGYDNIEPEVPEVDTTGSEHDIEDFSGVLRQVMLGTGALETHTYVLSNRDKLFRKMGVEEEEIAKMSNALTREYTAVRNWLMPSLVEVLVRNRHRSYPQRFFEIGRVTELDDSGVGASDSRKLVYLASGSEADFTHAREVLQFLERELGLEIETREGGPGCMEGDRKAEVLVEGEEVGFLGELSQDVLENWELDVQVSGFELDVKMLYRYYS